MEVMTGICMSYIFSWTLPLQLAASGHFWSSKRPGPLQTCTYCESATHSRLGPAKVPQPGVDLIHMAAPASSLVRNTVTVHDGWYDGLTVKSNKPLMKLFLGARVNTLKCKTFIQTFGGKSLCQSSASAERTLRTCININHTISIVQGKHRYISHINLVYATLVYATFHSGICHFPFWHMPLSILVYATFHFGI
jgi:hypothetical protein